jgi:hypothetical protein
MIQSHIKYKASENVPRAGLQQGSFRIVFGRGQQGPAHGLALRARRGHFRLHGDIGRHERKQKGSSSVSGILQGQE